MQDCLPPAILNRRKTGFGAPIRAWLGRGKLRGLAADVIGSRRFRERGLFDVAAVETLMRDTAAGRRDGAYLLLAILMVEFWLQQFSDIVAAPPAVARQRTAAAAAN